MKVKEAWKVVATEKMSYAKAICSVAKPNVVKTKPDSARALGGRPDSTVRCRPMRGRADVIEATIAKPVKMQWKLKSSTCSIACQTDPEPVEVMTQTTMDCASQTEDIPAEKSVQTSADAEQQTAKVGEEFAEEDKFAIAALFDMVDLMHRYASRRITKAAVYAERFERFDSQAYQVMRKRNYWPESESDDDEDEEDSQKPKDQPAEAN